MKLKPKTMWVAIDSSARSFDGALGLKGDHPVGCHFVACFYLRKFAQRAAKQWGSGKTLKVKLAAENTSVPRGA